MANEFNFNPNKITLDGFGMVSHTTSRGNFSNDVDTKANHGVPETSGGSGALIYKLYAYSLDNVANSYGYTEKKDVQIGDVLLLPASTGSGEISDPSDLTQVFEITEVHDDGTIYAQKDDSSSPIHLSRSSENDYQEAITDIRDVTDVSQNGLLVAEKGVMFKMVNINV